LKTPGEKTFQEKDVKRIGWGVTEKKKKAVGRGNVAIEKCWKCKNPGRPGWADARVMAETNLEKKIRTSSLTSPGNATARKVIREANSHGRKFRRKKRFNKGPEEQKKKT